MLPVLAFALVLAGPDPLVAATDATDRNARDRGAYAIARAFDSANTAQASLVRRLFDAGESDQSDAVIRGLLARRDRPEWFTAQLDRLRTAKRIPTEQYLYETPRDEVVTFLLHNADQYQVNSRESWIPVAWTLGDERLRPKSEEYARLKGTDRGLLTAGPTSLGGCSLEACLETFAMLAWLHRDLATLYDAYDGKQAFLTPENKLMLARIKAAGGDKAALADLVDATRTWTDPTWRGRAFRWVLSTPPAPNREGVAAAVAMLRGDPNGRNRWAAAEFLSALVERDSASSELQDVFVGALEDGSVDVRLEAAAGLYSLRAAEPARRNAAKTEQDAAVKALLLAGLAQP